MRMETNQTHQPNGEQEWRQSKNGEVKSSKISPPDGRELKEAGECEESDTNYLS